MATYSKTYSAIAGFNYIAPTELSYVTILSVSRDGMGYKQGSGTPGNMEFVYTEATGRIEFLISFPTGESVPHILYKGIHVIYKI